MPIARLEKLDLRELWKHEANDFTKWLCKNLDFVSEAIGINLSLVEREASAGAFSVDISAEDDQGHPVIIENQLEQTNHDHLGKLITYMSNLDAKTAIWITSEPRPEHEKAVHWLNETLPEDTAFYLLKIEAFKIGNSEPAPQLSVVAGPSQISRRVGEQKKELAERHYLRMEFWKQLLVKAKGKTHLFERKSPSYNNWLSTRADKAGFAYSLVIRMEDAQAEFYIDHGEADENKRLFDIFLNKKTEIEEKFGSSLDWQRLDDRKPCRIRYLVHGLGLADQNRWPELQDKLINSIIQLEKVMKPILQNINLHE
jgi:hypothetical protein